MSSGSKQVSVDDHRPVVVSGSAEAPAGWPPGRCCARRHMASACMATTIASLRDLTEPGGEAAEQPMTKLNVRPVTIITQPAASEGRQDDFLAGPVGCGSLVPP